MSVEEIKRAVAEVLAESMPGKVLADGTEFAPADYCMNRFKGLSLPMLHTLVENGIIKSKKLGSSNQASRLFCVVDLSEWFHSNRDIEGNLIETQPSHKATEDKGMEAA